MVALPFYLFVSETRPIPRATPTRRARPQGHTRAGAKPARGEESPRRPTMRRRCGRFSWGTCLRASTQRRSRPSSRSMARWNRSGFARSPYRGWRSTRLGIRYGAPRHVALTCNFCCETGGSEGYEDGTRMLGKKVEQQSKCVGFNRIAYPAFGCLVCLNTDKVLVRKLLQFQI